MTRILLKIGVPIPESRLTVVLFWISDAQHMPYDRWTPSWGVHGAHLFGEWECWRHLWLLPHCFAFCTCLHIGLNSCTHYIWRKFTSRLSDNLVWNSSHTDRKIEAERRRGKVRGSVQSRRSAPRIWPAMVLSSDEQRGRVLIPHCSVVTAHTELHSSKQRYKYRVTHGTHVQLCTVDVVYKAWTRACSTNVLKMPIEKFIAAIIFMLVIQKVTLKDWSFIRNWYGDFQYMRISYLKQLPLV